ncbi:hypothetical protein ACH3XW_31615 [Acanthocheilonema viteae]
MSYCQLILLSLLVTVIDLTVDGKCVGCSGTEIYQNRMKRALHPSLLFPFIFPQPRASNLNSRDENRFNPFLNLFFPFTLYNPFDPFNLFAAFNNFRANQYASTASNLFGNVRNNPFNVNNGQRTGR